MTEVEPPPTQNGNINVDEDESHKSRPADIEQDMREMERRKRVEAIMSSRLFREELERIVDSQMREGGASGILQQLSDIVGVPASRVGSIFKSSNCVLPINDIRGVESMGYAKGEKILRCKLAATFRLLDLYGWSQGLGAQITARLQADQELFLVNPFGLLFHEVTASSLNKVDMQGNIVEQGTTNFGINANYYVLHSVVHAARPDIRCAIYIGCNPVVAVSSLKIGLLPLTKDSAVLGEIATHPYTGSLNEPEEREKLIRSLGPISKVLLLNNHGALCCGETIEEAFYAAYHIVQACETQLKLLPVGLENLVLIPEETRKVIYDESRKPPEGYEHKSTSGDTSQQQQPDNKESSGKDVKDGGGGKEAKDKLLHQKPKWRVGGAEFEALMRMLDNAGFRTGYIYRHPLVKSELPKPKNDVEVPPAVSSLGYLLEEEELYRQGVWKKSDLRKGGDRTRWLNSPNVYQKVEVLETGTPDPKKITKWVADGSPTHSTPVKIENALQFVPKGTNPREFKSLQQLIKENRRADKISAGPQSHILEGVTWDEANRIRDATVSATGDHVVLVGAASKGIIQRGYQHNATVYKAPYAKNPFDSVTDDELNEYKRTIERKHGHGEYTDTDFSESEALSSLQTSGAQQKSSAKNVQSQSETEDASEPQVLRIETKQAPKPSQPEVVLSDANTDFLNMERAHVTTSKKPPTGRAFNNNCNIKTNNFGSNLLKYEENSSNNNYNELNKNQTNTRINMKSLNININETINDNDNLEIIKKRDNLHKELIQKFCKLNYLNSVEIIDDKSLNSVNDDDNNDYYYDGNNVVNDDDSDEDEDYKSLSPSSSSYTSLDIVEKFRNSHHSPNRNNNNDYLSNINYYIDIDSYNPYCNISNQYSDELDNYSISSNEQPYFDNANQSNLVNKNKLNQKSDSYRCQPYRTVSHYGFNSPLFAKMPEHKHIPVIPTKYKPIKRYASYEEIFANPCNLNQSIDDKQFNRALKNKALYNLIKQRQKISSPRKKRFSSEQTRDKNDDFYDNHNEYYDYVDYNMTPYKILITDVNKLDTILEEDETRTSNNNTQPIITTKAKIIDNDNNSNGTLMRVDFIEKITNLNYSGESPNLNFNGNSKQSVNSDLTLSCGKSVNDENVFEKDEEKDDEKDENLNNTKRSEIDVENVELTNSEKKRRKLMLREERLQRKEEFQELWEDHLLYYSNSNSTDMCNSSDDEGHNYDDNDKENHQLKKSGQNNDTQGGTGDDSEIISDSKKHKMISGQTHDENSLEIAQISFNENLLSYDNLAIIHNQEDENGTFVNKLFILMNELTTECCDQQSTINSNSNVGSSNEQKKIIEKIFLTDVNAHDISLQSPTNYLSFLPAQNRSDSSNNQNDDENELNSIEKKILEKIEHSDLDRSEGTIFNKIENAIRHKVTPLKLEKTINKECSKEREMHSSTPTLYTSNNNGNSSIKSLYSLNLSDVKSVDSKNQQTYSTTPKLSCGKKCSEVVSVKSTSHYKLTKQKSVKPIRKSIGQKMRTTTDSSLLKSSNKLNVKLNVTHCTSPPKENNDKSKSKKRNFINENIKNISSYSFRRHNLGAIFAINPFDDKKCNSNGDTVDGSIKSKSVNNAKLLKSSEKKTSSPPDIFSFETCKSSRGSPRFWVSLSSSKMYPRREASNINRNIKKGNKSSNLVKKDTSKKCQKSKSLNNQQGIKKISSLTDPSLPNKLIKNNENIIVGYEMGENFNNKNNNVENEIKSLGAETKKLNKVLNCYDRKFDLHKRLMKKIDNDFNEVIDLQRNIETTRNEFKRNLFGLGNSNGLQQVPALDTSTVSISENDD